MIYAWASLVSFFFNDIARIRDWTRLQVQFSRALCNVVAYWSKMKTNGQTSLLSKSNFAGFLGISSALRGRYLSSIC